MKLLVPIAAVAASVAVGSGIAVVIAEGTGSSASPTTTVTRSITAASGSPAASSDSGESVGEIYRSARAGIVEITVTSTTSGSQGGFFGGPQTEQAQGTGFEIDDRGDIATNAHVVSGARSIKVETSDGVTHTATLVGSDPTTDVAVIRIDPSGTTLHPLQFGDSNSIRVGDAVVAIGDPFGLTNTVTAGIVSALNRTITSPNDHPISGVIQTDAAINHGNSGGPLFNDHGQVIGITSQIYSGNGASGNVGIGFAVPSSTVRTVINEILAHGKASHPYLGVYLTDVTGAVARETGMPVGVEITRVRPDSPASRVGLRGATGQATVGAGSFPTGGDVITKLDGTAVTSTDDFVARISALQPGRRIELTVVRDGHERTVDVTLGTQG